MKKKFPHPNYFWSVLNLKIFEKLYHIKKEKQGQKWFSKINWKTNPNLCPHISETITYYTETFIKIKRRIKNSATMQYDHKFKLMMLGDAGVGKTSIARWVQTK